MFHDHAQAYLLLFLQLIRSCTPYLVNGGTHSVINEAVMPFLCDKSAESLDMSEVEGDSAGGDTEKSLGGNSASSSLDTAPR